MSKDLCPLCHYNGVELRAEAQRWRLAFQGERALAHALTDRLTSAQNAALHHDRIAMGYTPEPVPELPDDVAIAANPPPRIWRRPRTSNDTQAST